MWEWLRGNLTGVYFRRQAVVAGKIVDFYSGLVRIAVEVDGNMHDPIKDRERDEYLRGVGVLTIRIPARRVYQEMGAVLGLWWDSSVGCALSMESNAGGLLLKRSWPQSVRRSVRSPAQSVRAGHYFLARPGRAEPDCKGSP